MWKHTNCETHKCIDIYRDSFASYHISKEGFIKMIINRPFVSVMMSPFVNICNPHVNVILCLPFPLVSVFRIVLEKLGLLGRVEPQQAKKKIEKNK